MRYEPKLNVLAGICLAAFLAMNPVLASGRAQNQQPDNTKVNQSDRKDTTPTADKAKNNMSDRQLMASIRRDVVRDKSISTYGHNVKIVAVHGQVTLRGPVHSEDEKRAIEEHARKYAGDGKVTNEITVKGEGK
jgi:osmotically-inducible protein OsmY